MKDIHQIHINNILGATLNTREAVQEIITLIKANPSQLIELDFTNVEFMSRSFADELYKEKMKALQQYNIVLEIKNANTEIVKMLEAVGKTQNATDRKTNAIPVLQFDDLTKLQQHLRNL